MTSTQPFFSLDTLGLNASSTQILQDWLDNMQIAFPGYNPSQGNLEYLTAVIWASHAADLAQLCSQGANALFEQFGSQLFGVLPESGSPAIAVVSVTAVDAAGYTLPAGTQFLLTLDDAPFGFASGSDLVIPPGSISGQLTVAAVQPGLAFNGAGAPAQLNTSVTWVQGVTVVTPASDGLDPEDEDNYLVRLRATLQLMKPAVITQQDFATMVLNFSPAPGTLQQAVGRATAIDGYDPGPAPAGPGWSALASGTNTYNNQREITVAITDDDGDALTNDTLAAVQQWLEPMREANFIVNVVGPNYNDVYVACTIAAVVGFDHTAVAAAVQTALLQYLSPANFGLAVDTRIGWQNTVKVFRSRVEAAIQNTLGVDSIVPGTLALGLTGPPTNLTTDLTLSGPFPIARSSITTIPASNITVI